MSQFLDEIVFFIVNWGLHQIMHFILIRNVSLYYVLQSDCNFPFIYPIPYLDKNSLLLSFVLYSDMNHFYLSLFPYFDRISLLLVIQSNNNFLVGAIIL
jgi:hypothetical protein